MIRDFTDEAKNTLYDQIDSVTPQDGIDTVLDYLSDVYMHHPQMLEIIGATKNMNDMKTYHEYMLDRNNTSKEKIDTIFADVEQVEKDYSPKLVASLSYMTTTVNYFDRMASMIKPGGSMLLRMSAEQLRAQTTNWGDALYDLLTMGFDIQVNDDNREALEQKLEDLTNNRYNGQQDVSGMNRDDVENLVKLYEKLYPMDAKNMDNMLGTGKNNTLTDDDKYNIKYIVYTAAEPYRSVYLAYMDDYEIGSFGGRDDGFNKVEGAYYSSSFDELYFADTLSAFATDPRGPYTTWFHENGHAIDYNAGVKKSFYCYDFTTYSSLMNDTVTLQEAIYFDVYNDIESKIVNVAGTSNVNVNIILDSFRYDWQNVQLTQLEQYVRNQVLKMYGPSGSDDLSGEVNEAAADVYGGVTNLAINVGYGHRGQDDNGNYTYWYDSDGNAKLSQSKELVAEYFSYYMTDNQAAIASTRAHFPAACEVLDDMFEELKKEEEDNEKK